MHQIAEYLQRNSTHAHLPCQNVSLSNYIPSASLPPLVLVLKGGLLNWFRHEEGVVLQVPAFDFSKLANVSVRCTGLLQGEDEDGQCI